MQKICIAENCYLVIIDDISIIFGSPPEWIKKIGNYTFPEYVFLGSTILSNGFNFYETEFPVYKNFFFNKLKKTKFILPKENINRIREILKNTIIGPNLFSYNYFAQKASFFQARLAIHKNFNPSERRLEIDDFAEFHSYNSNGEFFIKDIKISRIENDTFIICYNHKEIVIELKEPINKKNLQNIVINGKLSIFTFDSGDGFSPNKATSSFLLNINGEYILFDPNYSSFDTLKSINNSIERVKAIFISHMHADHDQGLYRLLYSKPNIPIITGDIVYNSLMKKLSNLYGITIEEVENRFNLIKIPLQKKTSIQIIDISIFCDISFHTIPTVMSKFYIKNHGTSKKTILYSGDILFDPSEFTKEDFNKDYKKDIYNFYNDADIIIHEAGKGLIHTDPENVCKFLPDNKTIFWLHTSETDSKSFPWGHILKKNENIII